MRAARPVRGRLCSVIPILGVILQFDPMGFLCGPSRPRYPLLNTGDRDRLALCASRVSQSGDAGIGRLIPLRGPDPSFGHRLEEGSFNVSPGRELIRGDAGDRMADTIRRWADKSPR